jgi:3D (Asp-Asp-Asp) domain-containing protein
MIRVLSVFALILAIAGLLREIRWLPVRPPRDREPKVVALKVTGYCRCGECCSWRRNLLGIPVVSEGPGRGRLKMVGFTASGTFARPGTVAADTSLLPFGTIVRVPGYGYGRVEDVGQDIKGLHIDLFFRTHQEAMEWGATNLPVRVWGSRARHRTGPHAPRPGRSANATPTR